MLREGEDVPEDGGEKIQGWRSGWDWARGRRRRIGRGRSPDQFRSRESDRKREVRKKNAGDVIER